MRLKMIERYANFQVKLIYPLNIKIIVCNHLSINMVYYESFYSEKKNTLV